MSKDHPKIYTERKNGKTLINVLSGGIWCCLKRERGIGTKATLSNVKTAFSWNPALNCKVQKSKKKATLRGIQKSKKKATLRGIGTKATLSDVKTAFSWNPALTCKVQKSKKKATPTYVHRADPFCSLSWPNLQNIDPIDFVSIDI